jgi:hypothetical protein
VARSSGDSKTSWRSSLPILADLITSPKAQRQIIRRIASMSVWCESEEAKMADGAEVDIDRFQRTANSLRRLCESIGLKRVARDITPDLAT